MKYLEKTIKSEKIFQGNIIKVRSDTVELCNGKTATRDVVEHPGGVGIVAFTDSGKIILVKQFRKPLEDEIWEIPAGKLNYGEDHYSCGMRELEEETGYTAGRFEYLGYFFPTPGFCNEKIHIYYADNLKSGQVNPDEDEFLDVAEFTQEEVMDMILSGEIKDGKTVIGILKTRELINLGKL